MIIINIYQAFLNKSFSVVANINNLIELTDYIKHMSIDVKKSINSSLKEQVYQTLTFTLM